jgi:outer membrane receptor protein involved in Fe transport
VEGADDDEGGKKGTWDAALRGDRMRVGTRVFVGEGTAPGLSGRRAIPFFAAISSHRTGWRYGVNLRGRYWSLLFFSYSRAAIGHY